MKNKTLMNLSNNNIISIFVSLGLVIWRFLVIAYIDYNEYLINPLVRGSLPEIP